MFIFYCGYYCLQNHTFFPVPRAFSDGRFVDHLAFKLHAGMFSTLLVMSIKHRALISKGTSFDAVDAQSDVSIATLATVALDTNTAFYTRANGTFTIAVPACLTLRIHSTNVQAADIRAACLVFRPICNVFALYIIVMLR